MTNILGDVYLQTILRTERKRLGLGESRVGLGRVVQTPDAQAALSADRILECLARHQAGQWGLIQEDDHATNETSLKEGGRVMSAWAIDPDKPSKGWGDNTLWIITEAVGISTTILLPDEY